MKVKIGTYTSDGERFTLDIGFRPHKIYIKGDSTLNLAQRSRETWCARTNVLAAADSFFDGVAFVQDTVVIGASTLINTNGVKYYWLAIGDDGSDDFDCQSWMGNGAAGNVIDLAVAKTPVFAEIKRDSTRAAVLRFDGKSSVLADGAAVDECVSSMGTGSITLTDVVNGNEYNEATGIGEGIDGFFVFGDSPNVKVVTYTSPAVGEFVPTGCDPLAAIIVRTSSTGLAARFLTRDMDDSAAAPVDNVALNAGEAQLVPGGILIGTSTNLRSGTFSAIVFGRRETAYEKRPPAIIVRERKGVYLPGRGTVAHVDCGTSDATLKIDGPISIEWYGFLWADQYNGKIGSHLLSRGVGPSATAGAYSWGLHAIQARDHGWSGPQLAALCTNQFNEAPDTGLDLAVWRTGILMPWGNPAHIVVVHEGYGRWLMYLNGKLVKQRRRNLAVNIASGVGHRTAFGMRRNTADTAWTQAQRMIILSGRVYSAALSQDQVIVRFEREAMGSAVGDITSNLAEAWDADDASGLVLPAQVNAANNGAISATARIITL